MNTAGLVQALSAASLTLLLAAGCDGPAMSRGEERRAMMGSFGSVVAYGPPDSGHAVHSRALDEMARVDLLMSHYKPDSEVSRITRLTGVAAVSVDPDTLFVLEPAQRLGHETGGAFDVTVLPLVRLWGFFSHDAHVPTAAEIAVAREDVGFDGVLVDRDAATVMLSREGMELDLGAIAKGHAVDLAARSLRADGVRSALVNLSNSTFYALGAPEEADDWRVAVRHPRAADEQLGVILLSDAALATSADSEQFFERDGVRYGHILDPRTGSPASNGVVSVTVVADTGIEADALATAVFVLGPYEGMELIQARSRVDALVVTEEPDGRLTLAVSSGMARRFLPAQVEERPPRE